MRCHLSCYDTARRPSPDADPLALDCPAIQTLTIDDTLCQSGQMEMAQVRLCLTWGYLGFGRREKTLKEPLDHQGAKSEVLTSAAGHSNDQSGAGVSLHSGILIPFVPPFRIHPGPSDSQQ
ncbi:uncharacterized protein LOC128928843 [Callithrix jacchus]